MPTRETPVTVAPLLTAMLLVAKVLVLTPEAASEYVMVTVVVVFEASVAVTLGALVRLAVGATVSTMNEPNDVRCPP